MIHVNDFDTMEDLAAHLTTGANNKTSSPIVLGRNMTILAFVTRVGHVIGQQPANRDWDGIMTPRVYVI
jgi:hypothetical protein